MGLFNWIKNVLGFETEEGTTETAANTGGVVQAPVAQTTVSLPMDEEEKTLVAVIASCISGKDQPNAQLHIQRITRIQ